MKTKSAFIVFAVVALIGVGWWFVGRWFGSKSDTQRGASEALVLAVESAPTTIAPLNVTDLGSSLVAALAHSPLVLVDSEGKVVPALAQSVTVAPDAMSARIVLNAAARFADGSPVTAEDVEASLMGLRDSSSPLRVAMERLQGFEIISPTELVARVAKPEPEFVKMVACLAASITKKGTAANPKQFLDSQVVGAGAWRLKMDESSPGQQYVFERNAGFPITSNVKRLVVKVFGSHQAALAAFKSGEVDAYRLRGPAVTEAISDGRLRPEFASAGHLAKARAAEVSIALVNWNSAKLRNIAPAERTNLMQRLSAAIPRKEIAAALGTAHSLRHLVPPAALAMGAGEEAPPAPSDWPQNVSLELSSANDAQSRQLATLLQSVFSKLNVQTDTRAAEIGDLIGSIMKGDFDVAVTFIESALDTPGNFTQFFTEGSPYVAFGQGIAGLREKVEEARGILDPAERLKKWAEAIAWLETQQTAWMPIVTRDSVLLLSSRISDARFESTGTPNWSFVQFR